MTRPPFGGAANFFPGLTLSRACQAALRDLAHHDDERLIPMIDSAQIEAIRMECLEIACRIGREIGDGDLGPLIARRSWDALDAARAFTAFVLGQEPDGVKVRLACLYLAARDAGGSAAEIVDRAAGFTCFVAGLDAPDVPPIIAASSARDPARRLGGPYDG